MCSDALEFANLDVLNIDSLIDALNRLNCKCYYQYGKGKYYISIDSVKACGYSDTRIVVISVYNSCGDRLEMLNIPIDAPVIIASEI